MKIITLVLLASMLGGCASTVVLTLNNGETVEGVYGSGSPEHLYIEDAEFSDPEDAIRHGDELALIDRSRIKSIDHPGNLMMLIGIGVGLSGIALGAGGVLLGLDSGVGVVALSFGIGSTIIGVTLASIGVTLWSSSVRDIRDSARPFDAVMVSPGVVSDNVDAGPGVYMLLTF